MSEMQWAGLICSMNVGVGVACTIREAAGESVAPPPRRPAQAASAAEDVRRAAAASAADMAAVSARLSALLSDPKGPTKAQLRTLLEGVERARRSIGEGVPYLMERFAEVTAATVGAAQADINAYALMMGAGGAKAPARLSLDREPDDSAARV